MVSAQDAIHILSTLSEHGIPAWLSGGWGIDALLREQTRPHKDLDILVLVDDVVRLREVLGGAGYRLKELWEENTWVRDSYGAEVPTAFVLRDAEGRELDAHAMRMDVNGNGLPAWGDVDGLSLRPEDLRGEGVIAGCAVRCISAEMQALTHRGYQLPDVQRHDLRLLHERFGVQLPQ
jgi:lincosamide nucleotidyltransferase A/C/D/E